MHIETKYVLLYLCAIVCTVSSYQEFSDNEFAEFEDFEAEEEIAITTNSQPGTPDEPSQDFDAFVTDEEEENVDEDDSEFEHFHDVEEFEGFEGKDDKPITEPKITITKVPIHFRANWDSYWLEILMVVGLIVYFINFATGKSKNTKIANAWLQTHKSLLEENFAMVGDETAVDRSENGFVKESENVFTLWCSGRTCCEGMLVELKLIKRQDLVAVLAGMMRPSFDHVQIKVIMNKEDMDSFVFCVASKKIAMQFSKEMADISVYCPERRAGEKHDIPSHFSVMNEISEVASVMLDSKTTAIFNKYGEHIDYMHFSDQYSGPKQPVEETSAGAPKLPDTQKVLMFGFNMPLKGKPLDEAVNQIKPLMVMVFYYIEKVKRFRLSKEAKTKADKNRQKVEEAFLKSTHQARAEAAAARREERRRLEKEKVMADEDPDRQRRWEEKEQKRQAKKRAPKMKQLKVKAL